MRNYVCCGEGKLMGYKIYFTVSLDWFILGKKWCHGRSVTRQCWLHLCESQVLQKEVEWAVGLFLACMNRCMHFSGVHWIPPTQCGDCSSRLGWKHSAFCSVIFLLSTFSALHFSEMGQVWIQGVKICLGSQSSVFQGQWEIADFQLLWLLTG